MFEGRLEHFINDKKILLYEGKNITFIYQLYYFYKLYSFAFQTLNKLHVDCELFSIKFFINWTSMFLILSQHYIDNDNIGSIQSTLFIDILVTLGSHYAIGFKWYV